VTRAKRDTDTPANVARDWDDRCASEAVRLAALGFTYRAIAEQLGFAESKVWVEINNNQANQASLIELRKAQQETAIAALAGVGLDAVATLHMISSSQEAPIDERRKAAEGILSHLGKLTGTTRALTSITNNNTPTITLRIEDGADDQEQALDLLEKAYRHGDGLN